MPTILELFKSKELNFPGGSTADGLVDSAAQENRGGFKQDVTNFVQQELNGIRRESLVELNNPLIYGNQAIRIAQRTTPDKDEMREARGVSGAGGGLNLNKVISAGRDAFNSVLGIPETLLPTRVTKLDGTQKPVKGSGVAPINMNTHKTNVPITKEGYGKNGTGLGNLLKNSTGSPSTIGKQVVGNAIGAAKSGLRGVIFGKPGILNDAVPTFAPKREFYDENGGELPSSNFKQNGDNFYSKYVSSNSRNNIEETRQLMGIGQTGKSKDVVSPPGYYAPEKEDDKLIIPFWINSVTGAPKDKVFFKTVITGLTETSTPGYEGSKFIGNPFTYHIYTGVDRSVTFNLNLYCTSSDELLSNWNKLKYLTSKVYPIIKDDVMTAPFIKFQLGDMYINRTGFIETLTYTIPDNGTWEVDIRGLRLPKFIEAAITIKLIETPGDEEKIYDFNGLQQGVKVPVRPKPALQFNAEPRGLSIPMGLR
jgi:hypothetical protein